LAMTFFNLPVGIVFLNASGFDALNRPYVNFSPAIPSGGMLTGTESQPLLIEFSNPDELRFAIAAAVVTAGPNQSPTFPPIAPITVRPGEIFRTSLPKQDANGDQVAYSIESAQKLPAGSLNGVLEFRPTPEEVGSYTFMLVASDGAMETRQVVSLNVVADPLVSTRVSGRVLDVDGTPIGGLQVEIGAVRGLTGSDGAFSLDLGSGTPASETLRIRGDSLAGPNKYPFIAEKLPLLLGHAVYLGVNNAIARPIYLPKLDIAGGTRIDPTKDMLVTITAIPGMSVTVKAGTLMNQQSTPFDGILSFTKVPPALTPAALPANLRPDLVVTIQPGEMTFTVPAPLTFPNSANYPIGQKLDLWSINGSFYRRYCSRRDHYSHNLGRRQKQQLALSSTSCSRARARRRRRRGQ
jgi:hypothetical protein